MRYVCGNDSVTYDSECALRKKTCEAHNGPYVVVQHQGQCGELFCPHFSLVQDGTYEEDSGLQNDEAHQGHQGQCGELLTCLSV